MVVQREVIVCSDGDRVAGGEYRHGCSSGGGGGGGAG